MHRYQWHTQAWRPRRKYWNHLFYRPQKKFAKVTFSQVSVCPQGGVCLWSRGLCGRNPPGRHPSSGQTHHHGQTPPGQTPLGRHPQADAPGQTPPGQMVNKRAVHIPLECILVQKMRPCLLATIALKLSLLCLRNRLALFRQLSQSTKKNFRFDEFG